MPRANSQKEIGLMREQQILSSLRESPKTNAQLCEATGLRRASIALYLVRLHAEPKRAYISGHIMRSHGSPAPVWSAGDKPDVEYVPQSYPMPKTSAAERREQVLSLLTSRHMSMRQLADKMYVTPATAGRYVTKLRRNGEVYVCRWIAPYNAYPGTRAATWVPVYAVGNKPDVPMPKQESSSARHARLHAHEGYREERNKKRRLRYQVEKTRKKPNTIFAALGL